MGWAWDLLRIRSAFSLDVAAPLADVVYRLRSRVLPTPPSALGREFRLSFRLVRPSALAERQGYAGEVTDRGFALRRFERPMRRGGNAAGGARSGRVSSGRGSDPRGRRAPARLAPGLVRLVTLGTRSCSIDRGEKRRPSGENESGGRSGHVYGSRGTLVSASLVGYTASAAGDRRPVDRSGRLTARPNQACT